MANPSWLRDKNKAPPQLKQIEPRIMERNDSERPSTPAPILILLILTLPPGTAFLVSSINDQRAQKLTEQVEKTREQQAKKALALKALKTTLDKEKRSLELNEQAKQKQRARLALKAQREKLNAQNHKLGRIIDLDFDYVELGEALATVSKKAGLKIITDKELSKSETITLKAHKIHAPKALELIAQLTKIRVERVSESVFLVTDCPRVTINFVEADLRQVILLLAAYSGQRIVLDESVQGSITLDVKECFWDVALAAILRLGQLHAQENRGLILVSKNPFQGSWGHPFRPGPSLNEEFRSQEPPSKERLNQAISLVAADMDLGHVAEKLSAKAGLPVIVDPSVNESVTVKIDKRPWREALDRVAQSCHCIVEERWPGVFFFTQPPRVTVQFREANVHTVLTLLSAYSGKNIFLSKDLTGKVSLDIKDVPWDQALAAIAETCQFHIEQNHGLLLATPAPLKERWGPSLEVVESLSQEKQKRTPAKDSFFIAQDAPSALWFQCLGALADVNTISNIGRSQRFSGRFTDRHPLTVLDASAKALQLTVKKSPQLVTLRATPNSKASPSQKAPSVTAVTVKGKEYKLQLQATLGHNSKHIAIVSGDFYTEGRKLWDENQEEIPLGIAKIKAGELLLNIYDEGTKNPSRQITLRIPSN